MTIKSASEQNLSTLNCSDKHSNAQNRGLKFMIPWANTSLLYDLSSYFLLQPVFWVMGIEHFAPVVLGVWILFKRILTSLKLSLSLHSWLLIALFTWQLFHIITVPSGELDLFIKSQSTLLAPLCIFIAILNILNTKEKWDKFLGVLEKFGVILVFFGTIFIIGFWNGEFQSLIGYLLPKNIIASSHFFSSITTRTLGIPEPATGFRRVQSLLWHPNGYATVLVIIFAIEWYLFQNSSAKNRIFRGITILIIILNLIFTYSRTLYVAFLVMVVFAWWLMSYTKQSRFVRFLVVSAMIFSLLLYIFIALLVQGVLDLGTSSFIHDIIYEVRPYSVQIRLQIYEESWKLILQKPIWGWSALVKIDTLPSYFSAGSHSDFLSVLFLYGIPGFLLYASFIGSVWYTLIKGYRMTRDKKVKNFFALSIALMLAINLRQLTAGLLWDIYVGSSVWAIWGMALSLYAFEKRKSFVNDQDIGFEPKIS